MSELIQKVDTDKILKKRVIRKKVNELEDLKSWLTTLGMPITPTVHINGRDFPTAVLTVDFGTPLDLDSVKLSSDQTADLINKMKICTKSLYKNDMSIRVSTDNNTGIWWASVG